MIEIDLDAETLACLGMRRVDEEQWFPPRPSLLDVLGPAPKAKRTHRASIQQIAKQAGLTVVAVVEMAGGSRRYELGEKADALHSTNPWDSIYETAQKRPS